MIASEPPLVETTADFLSTDSDTEIDVLAVDGLFVELADVATAGVDAEVDGFLLATALGVFAGG